MLLLALELINSCGLVRESEPGCRPPRCCGAYLSIRTTAIDEINVRDFFFCSGSCGGDLRSPGAEPPDGTLVEVTGWSRLAKSVSLRRSRKATKATRIRCYSSSSTTGVGFGPAEIPAPQEKQEEGGLQAQIYLVCSNLAGSAKNPIAPSSCRRMLGRVNGTEVALGHVLWGCSGVLLGHPTHSPDGIYKGKRKPEAGVVNESGQCDRRSVAGTF